MGQPRPSSPSRIDPRLVLLTTKFHPQTAPGPRFAGFFLMTTILGLFFIGSEKTAYSFSVFGTTSRPGFVSSGGPVENVIWPAPAANAVNKIVIIVPISQPDRSINRSLA